MTSPVITLFQKELRQNAFIYLFPLVIIVAALTLQKVLEQILTVTWARNFAVAIPVGLAFSYALQAFDLEENSQTRDFLLTKPVSGSEIILAKYFCGLVVLLPLTILWQLALLPDLVQWPDPLNITSFSFFTYLLLVILVYSFSFATAPWVNGPIKLLAAIFVSSLGTIWFFYGWFQLLTLSYLVSVVNEIPIFLTILIPLALLVILIKMLFVSIRHQLLNHSFSELISGLKRHLLILLVPLIINAINWINSPEIRPFNSLLACLNGSEEPFFSVDISKQPQGENYALTDVRGRLALAKRGETPTVIYQGEKSDSNLLSKLTWSPNGAMIAFNENGAIKVLSPTQAEPVKLCDGDIPFWSADSKVLLVATKVNPDQAADYPVAFNHYRLSYVSLATKESYELSGNLSFPGSSMFWHPSLNAMIAVTDFWQIAFMHLNEGRVEMLQLPLPSKPEPIFLTKIAPSGNDSYRIAVFSGLKMEGNQEGRFSYDFLLYEFSVLSKTATLKAHWNDLKYQDILINPGDSAVWGSNSYGAYHRITLPRGD